MNAASKKQKSGAGLAALIALAGSLATGALPAEAGQQLQTPTMSCAEIRDYITAHGAAVLFTGPHLYDRYVDHQGYCPFMTRAEAAWVPAKDSPQCFVGYTCEQSNTRRRH